MKLKAKIIVGFPGVGKTHLANNCSDLKILDLDSSTYSKESSFPHNYILDIIKYSDSYDYILVSTHSAVRYELCSSRIPYILVYPKSDLLQEYLSRYKIRGSSLQFCKLVESNWMNFIEDLLEDSSPYRVALDSGEYLDISRLETLSST
ncbi:AAA family ATPase [Listeria phage LIS04]|nr:AAA family ATPase [Listeria phage LIS04]